ncbi:hypothetical protein EON65_39810 [archaeon]|nr:MAG: hypothetical protein EON65_39810 [archaeon]
MIYSNCSNVFNVYKVMMLKLSITVIVLEGLIAEFMVRFGGSPYDDDHDWSMEDQTYRGYCSLVLIEYAILTIPYLVLWAMKVTPPASSTADKQVTMAPLTFGEYVCKVFKLWDIKGVLPLNDLNKPLTQPTQKV